MILKRKSTAPIVVDSFGVSHPNLIVGFYALPEDKLNKWIEIRCGYFHSTSIYSSRKDKFLTDSDANLVGFTMRFDEILIPSVHDNGVLVKLGHPNYETLRQSIQVAENGTLTVLADDVIYWILNQEFYKDHEGKVFVENWEVDVTI